MIGILFIGISFLFGIAMRSAAYSGVLLFMTIWPALLLPEHNPILDEYVVYATRLIFLAELQAGDWFSFGKWWRHVKLSKIDLLFIR